MKDSRHIIASILLIAFGIMQLADFHVVEHDEHDIDCKICQLSSDQLNDYYDTIGQIALPELVIIPRNSHKIYGIDSFIDNCIHFSFQNKAPPVV